LLGAVNPSGRLPFSIPTDESHLAHWDPDARSETYDLWHGHWKLARDKNPAAYPFGFGLSYTTFAIDDAVVDGSTVRCRVTNRGERDGAEVVQLYAGLPSSRVERPARRLIGWARAEVAAGATVAVTIPIDLTDLRVRQNGSWVTETGTYGLVVARNVEDPAAIRLTTAIL
jgi:beta-glucosidase